MHVDRRMRGVLVKWFCVTFRDPVDGEGTIDWDMKGYSYEDARDRAEGNLAIMFDGAEVLYVEDLP